MAKGKSMSVFLWQYVFLKILYIMHIKVGESFLKFDLHVKSDIVYAIKNDNNEGLN